jgi:hypothetical protein
VSVSEDSLLCGEYTIATLFTVDAVMVKCMLDVVAVFQYLVEPIQYHIICGTRDFASSNNTGKKAREYQPGCQCAAAASNQ